MKKTCRMLVCFVLLVGSTACSNGETKDMYLSAIDDLENNNYLLAMNKFETLDNFKDSKDKYNESVYNFAKNETNLKRAYYLYEKVLDFRDSKSKQNEIALKLSNDYIANEDLANAILWIKKTDNKEQLNDLMYQYVQKNKNNKDITTYEYLKELSESNYKDSKDIYDNLYKLSYKVIINTNKDDFTTNLKKYSNGLWVDSKIYVHVVLNGGYPGQKVKLYLKHESLWGMNNTVSKNAKWDEESKTGLYLETEKDYTFPLTLSSNLYYHRYTLYDENSKEILQTTIHTPYY